MSEHTTGCREGHPCKADHNGECIICDCWLTECAFDRLAEGDFRYESLDQLLEMFKDFLTPDKVKELREKHSDKAGDLPLV